MSTSGGGVGVTTSARWPESMIKTEPRYCANELCRWYGVMRIAHVPYKPVGQDLHMAPTEVLCACGTATSREQPVGGVFLMGEDCWAGDLLQLDAGTGTLVRRRHGGQSFFMLVGDSRVGPTRVPKGSAVRQVVEAGVATSKLRVVASPTGES